MSDYTTLDGPNHIKNAVESYKIAAGNQRAIKRLPFSCEFTTPLTLEIFIETLNEIDNFILFTHQLSEDNYYSLTGVSNLADKPSSFNAEVCPEWMRVYIDYDTNTAGIKQLLQHIHEIYPFEIVVADDYLNATP